MNRGKYAAPRRRRRRSTLKPLLVAMAVVLLIGCVAGGTLAWLTSTTPEVTNTFTTSDINITLTETSTSGNPDVVEHNYKMIPGCTISKDPKASVVAGSEECYLFVKVTKSENFDSYMEYSIATGWTLVPGTTDVYYREVTTAEMGTPYSVLAGDTVTVKGAVTKEMMNSLTPETYPTLTFKAYAIQLYKNNTEKFSPAEAYDQVKTLITNS